MYRRKLSIATKHENAAVGGGGKLILLSSLNAAEDEFDVAVVFAVGWVVPARGDVVVALLFVLLVDVFAK